jgi:hypothetical protein
VFNATFSNISVISWRPVLVVEEAGLQMHQKANMNFVHSELVQVFYDIKWISSGAFEFEKKKKNP